MCGARGFEGGLDALGEAFSLEDRYEVGATRTHLRCPHREAVRAEDPGAGLRHECSRDRCEQSADQLNRERRIQPGRSGDARRVGSTDQRLWLSRILVNRATVTARTRHSGNPSAAPIAMRRIGRARYEPPQYGEAYGQKQPNSVNRRRCGCNLRRSRIIRNSKWF